VAQEIKCLTAAKVDVEVYEKTQSSRGLTKLLYVSIVANSAGRPRIVGITNVKIYIKVPP
jgi:hypothetical protein